MSTITKTIRVERSLEYLADLLGSRPPEWLLPFASIAVHTAEMGAQRRTGMSLKRPSRTRRISIDLTDVPQNDEIARVDVGVLWETRGFAHIFTSFEGRIVATRDSDEACTVALEGSYAPPKGRPGRHDHAAATAAAEAAIETLLSTLRDAVEEQARLSV